MTPPIFSILSTDAAVGALLGRNKACRVFAFGEAVSNVQEPYVVWQLGGGSPENLLAGIPNMDSFHTQIDVYARFPEPVREIARAVINALEPHAYVVNYNFEGREPETRLYRFSFSVEFMTPRDELVS